VPCSYQRYGGRFFSWKRSNQRAARVLAFLIIVIAVLLESKSPSIGQWYRGAERFDVMGVTGCHFGRRRNFSRHSTFSNISTISSAAEALRRAFGMPVVE
jgi:hypothetical protein